MACVHISEGKLRVRVRREPLAHSKSRVAVSFAMPTSRVTRAADEAARFVAARVGRWLLILLGLLLMAIGVAMAPLPGPLGVPVTVVGLMMVLRNSAKARRQFVRMQHAHPKMVFPIRRLLRREPEIIPVMWQQYLRIERVVLPSRIRFAIRVRHAARRRFRQRRTEGAS